METNKMIGIIMAWGVQDWIRLALNQAIEYCDETIVVVAPFGPTLRQYEDETYNICKEYKGIKFLDYEPHATNTKYAVCDIANHILKNSSLFMPGNWVWVLDADEFYTKSTYKEIKSIINDGGYDRIAMESKFFYINMQHYLDEAGDRIFEIVDMNDKFFPAIRWGRKPKKTYIIERSNGMFHYSMLTNTKRHYAKWLARGEKNKTRWHDEIYTKYDLENEEYWIEENLKLSGIRSPWLNEGFTPDENGRLFKYNGKHPKFVEKAGLIKIKDFRKRYTT